MELPPSDFDGAWKSALHQYFGPFLELFFPQAYAAIDWNKPVAFRETELQQIAPEDQAGKQRVDTLVQVTQRNDAPMWVLVHVEIQSQRDGSFAERMFRYHARIFDRARQPVVSLAVLGDEEPQWHPTQFGYGLWGCDLLLRFPVVKLQALPEATLEAVRNPLATLTLLHWDAQATRQNPQERLARKIARYRALLRQGYHVEDVRMLIRLMEHVMRRTPDLALVARDAMRQVEQEELGMETLVTSFEEIVRAEGRAGGQIEIIMRLLERKIGPLPTTDGAGTGSRPVHRAGARFERGAAQLQLSSRSDRLPRRAGWVIVGGRAARLDAQALRQVEQEELGMETFVTSFEEIGLAEGLAKGRAEGQIEIIMRQLERKIGPLPTPEQERVVALESAQALALSEALLDFGSLADLTAWLDTQDA